VGVGHVPLCKWAERGFGSVAVKLVFHFSNIFKFLQILKKLCRIHLNSENYEINFVG
jgi:hypothetical protein